MFKAQCVLGGNHQLTTPFSVHSMYSRNGYSKSKTLSFSRVIFKCNVFPNLSSNWHRSSLDCPGCNLFCLLISISVLQLQTSPVTLPTNSANIIRLNNKFKYTFRIGEDSAGVPFGGSQEVCRIRHWLTQFVHVWLDGFQQLFRILLDLGPKLGT